MRVALSRPCPGGSFSRFQAAPVWTPAAICQNCGLPPTASPSPRGCCLCPYLGCKGTAIFFNCKKKFKKYLISLIIKHLQRGIFAVKRFNRPCPWVWGDPVAPYTHARVYARMHAGIHYGYLLKRFVLDSRHPGGIFVLRRTQDTKIKRFNRLCQNIAQIAPLYMFYVMY